MDLGSHLFDHPLLYFPRHRYNLGHLYGVSNKDNHLFSVCRAIEVITSQTQIKEIKDSQGNVIGTIEEIVWNPTVANLSLMALGSSAPEIMLSVIETVTYIDNDWLIDLAGFTRIGENFCEISHGFAFPKMIVHLLFLQQFIFFLYGTNSIPYKPNLI